MGQFQLSVTQTQAMFIELSGKMVESKDQLTQADKAIGDGDHGVGMARGFAAVKQKLEEQTFTALDQLLKTMGMTLMMSIGGAAGAIFGTFFSGGAKNLQDQPLFDAEALSRMLADGLEAVQARGKARPGDKTMVDALMPASQTAQEMASTPLNEVLPAVTEAARTGMEQTKNMVATIGKAKTLGERSLGHADPGAISTYLILKFMAEYVDANE
jgi:dihydroxyacetone kinase-like protein